MDKLDFWKKYPCVLLGTPFQYCPTTPSYGGVAEMLHAFSQKHLNDFFFFIHTPSSSIESELTLLLKAGASADQIFLLGSENKAREIAAIHKICLIPLFEAEEVEEFRIRLMGRLEVQRQEKFQREVEWLRATQNLSDERKSLERGRLAHSLAVSMRLSPQSHTNALRWAFLFEQKAEAVRHVSSLEKLLPVAEKFREKTDALEPWPVDFPIELLIVESAELAILSAHQTAEFRKFFRAKSALLSFKQRADLKNAIENCFLHVWEDHPNAA